MNHEIQNIFTEIYEQNKWGAAETRSGAGSTMRVAWRLVDPIIDIVQGYCIGSVLDMGCGECNWQQKINWEVLRTSYLGTDVVPAIIKQNTKRYADNLMQFELSDATGPYTRQVDLIIFRDVAIHLTLKQITAALENFRASGSLYLLASNYKSTTENRDIKVGDWRPINMELAPFNMGPPLQTIQEHSTDGLFRDKQLALWKL